MARHHTAISIGGREGGNKHTQNPVITMVTIHVHRVEDYTVCQLQSSLPPPPSMCMCDMGKIQSGSQDFPPRN